VTGGRQTRHLLCGDFEKDRRVDRQVAQSLSAVSVCLERVDCVRRVQSEGILIQARRGTLTYVIAPAASSGEFLGMRRYFFAISHVSKEGHTLVDEWGTMLEDTKAAIFFARRILRDLKARVDDRPGWRLVVIRDTPICDISFDPPHRVTWLLPQKRRAS
jgi:hypothetical protein